MSKVVRAAPYLICARFLVEPSFRREFLTTVADKGVVYFWENEFPMLRKNAAAPLITRLDTFLRPHVIRNMVGQRKGIDLPTLVSKRKIILVKLAQGLIGRENSFLLGTLLVTKLNQTVKARQAQAKQSREPFYLYIDEFQNFLVPSMEDILSGARKYGLGLVLAHQGLAQLMSNDQVLREAVIANAGTRIVFRVGDNDAKFLANGFAGFAAEDIQGLAVGQAIIRVGQIDADCNVTTHLLPPLKEEEREHNTKAVIAESRKRYSRPQEIVEAEIERLLYGGKTEPRESPPSEPKESEQTAIEIEKIAPKEQTIGKQAADFVKKETERVRTKKHLQLQNQLKALGEAKNYKVVLEQPTPDGKGRIDVVFTQGAIALACEISVTNTPAYEVGNIQKCLRAGFAMVLFTSPDAHHLQAVQTLAKETLTDDQFTQTVFLPPERIAAYLDQLLPAEPVEQRIKGYRVKVNYQNVSPLEQAEKKDTLTKLFGKLWQKK